MEKKIDVIPLLTGIKGAFVLGKLQPVNYGEQVPRVRRNALHVQTVSVAFEDGFSSGLPYRELSKECSSHPRMQPAPF